VVAVESCKSLPSVRRGLLSRRFQGAGLIVYEFCVFCLVCREAFPRRESNITKAGTSTKVGHLGLVRFFRPLKRGRRRTQRGSSTTGRKRYIAMAARRSSVTYIERLREGDRNGRCHDEPSSTSAMCSETTKGGLESNNNKKSVATERGAGRPRRGRCRAKVL
jgi:hypothetical protein